MDIAYQHLENMKIQRLRRYMKAEGCKFHVACKAEAELGPYFITDENRMVIASQISDLDSLLAEIGHEKKTSVKRAINK